MANSRKLPSASALPKAKKIAVALSGGVDSVVLLHLLKDRPGVFAVHVHHGLSPNADAWTTFCRTLCKRLDVPLVVRKVKVHRSGKGLEAAAREARYGVFRTLEADCVALAHQLDDQAETLLMNLLRGAGVRGARAMQGVSRFDGKLLARPLLDVSRAAILDYARRHGLEWIEDESNADEALTRNFIRLRVGPLLEERFPRWKESLARAARLFSRQDDRASRLLREFLKAKGLKAPSEAKLVEMLRQLTRAAPATKIEHDGTTLRIYRHRVFTDNESQPTFEPLSWRGERRLKIPALGGELRFKRGEGIDARLVKESALEVRLRSGGERLQLDPRRPRRTLKNLFQEAGVPPWVRSRTPLIYRGADLVWAPGLGVDVRYRGRGFVPEWVSDRGA